MDKSRMRALIAVGIGVAILGFSPGCDDSTSPEDTPFEPELLDTHVVGFPPMPVPEDNPQTREGVDLGRMLFYDPIFSADSTLACGTCHAHEYAFTDHNNQFSAGVDGRTGTRNAPQLTNVAWEPRPSWDGRIESVEHMVMGTIPLSPGMQSSWPEAIAKLEAHPEYPAMFVRAFGDRTITPERAAKAIGQFTRTFVSNNSKFDQFMRGETNLTPEELHGFEVFFTERGDCFHCHTPIHFSDYRYHNNGLEEEIVDLGRGAITGDPLDIGKFKTPSLRNLRWTAPYMHDGRFETLEEVIDHYDSGGFRSPTVDPLIRVGVGLELTDTEKRDLIAFILTLSDDSFINNPDLSNPFE